jgi:hypothetical protein
MVIVLLALPGFAATGKGILYDCDITEKRDRLFWISDKMAIVITGEGQVVVSDQVILHFNEKPMQARVTRNTARKMTIRWTIRNAVDGNNQTVSRLNYTAVLSKDDNRIEVYARPQGFSNRFGGKGQCATRNG